jgi:hypothetical protein
MSPLLTGEYLSFDSVISRALCRDEVGDRKYSGKTFLQYLRLHFLQVGRTSVRVCERFATEWEGVGKENRDVDAEARAPEREVSDAGGGTHGLVEQRKRMQAGERRPVTRV